MTPHNEANKGDIAKTVIMPGDPNRAKYIADNFLYDVKLVNKVRGILAYTGKYKEKEVTVMASGMGIPSMGIYSYELYKFYDVENIIRIGTAGSYLEDLKLFDIVLVNESYTKSTFAKIQGCNLDTIKSSEKLNDVIKSIDNNIRVGKVYSTDVFYIDEDINEYVDKGCLCTEMESFALFYNAYKLGKEAACILTISDNLVNHEETTAEQREKTLNKMITLALESVIKL